MINGFFMCCYISYILGDDCIAITGERGGSSDINITRVACGPGHGIRFLDITAQRDSNSSVFYLFHENYFKH